LNSSFSFKGLLFPSFQLHSFRSRSRRCWIYASRILMVSVSCSMLGFVWIFAGAPAKSLPLSFDSGLSELQRIICGMSALENQRRKNAHTTSV
ncbi:hypothetical protein WG66_013632, partial [Moniliophthora roreri]